MTHCMTLNPAPFDKIFNGTKTIELRLNDDKRKVIHVNDKIIFKHKEDNKKSIVVKVIKLHKFNSFKELYSTLPLLKCGYTKDNISTAKADDMLKYYSKEQQAKHGALGIEFERIDS